MEAAWSQDWDDVRISQVLDWLLDLENNGSPSHVTIAQFFDEHDAGDAGPVADRMVHEGLVRVAQSDYRLSSRSNAGMPVILEASGHGRAVEEAKAARDRRVRRTAAQCALLDFVDEFTDVVTEALLDDPRGHVYGRPFSKEDAYAASEVLVHWGLVAADGTGRSGGGVIRPRITPDGRDVADRYGSNIPLWRATVDGTGAVPSIRNEVKIYGGMYGGQVGAGGTVSQYQTVGRNLDDLRPLIEAVRTEILTIEDEQDREDASEELAEVEQELASPEPRQSWLRRRFKTLMALTATGASTGAAEALSIAAMHHFGVG